MKRWRQVSLFKNWLTKAWLCHLVDWPFRQRSCHSPLLPLNSNLTPCHIPSLVTILICRSPGPSKAVNSWSSLQIGRLCYGSMNTASPKWQKFLKRVYLTLGYNFNIWNVWGCCLKVCTTWNKSTKLQSWDLIQELLRNSFWFYHSVPNCSMISHQAGLARVLSHQKKK